MAIRTQGLALVLLLALLFLPVAPLPFLVLLVGLVLWLFQPGHDVTEPSVTALSNLFLYAGCLWGMIISPGSRWVADLGTLADAPFICTFAWLFCLVCVGEGYSLGFPMAMLSCLSFVLVTQLELPHVLLAVAVLLLTGSGAMVFLDSLRSPDRSEADRASAWGATPHLLVTALSLVIMMLTTDFVKKTRSRLRGAITPRGSGRDEYCVLAAPPPRFTGDYVCMIYSPESPPPHYLAERFFLNYGNGLWKDGKRCYNQMHRYGSLFNSKNFHVDGTCAITMFSQKTPPLIPHGVWYDPNADYYNFDKKGTSENDLISAHFKWTRNLPAAPEEGGHSLQLPKQGLHTLQLVTRRICEGAVSDSERIRMIVHYLESNMEYDASQELRRGLSVDPVESFLFDTKRGWCVHFATAAALMLRSAGIPTRMVLGFIIPKKKETVRVVDNWGHAWCEALIRSGTEHTWVVVDPSRYSALIAPRRWKQLKQFISVAVIIAVACLFFQYGRQIDIYDFRKEIEEEPPNLSEDEQICVAYHRCLRYLARTGIAKPESMSPGQFAKNVVPEKYRSDFLKLTRAFEKIKYMGYRHLGGLGREAIEAHNSIIFEQWKISRKLKQRS